MKHTFASILAVLALWGCQKEETEPAAEVPATAQGAYTIPYSSIRLVNGMLEFPDMATFTQVRDELDRQSDLYDADHVAAHPHLTEEELNDQDDDKGYEPLQPIVDFETYYAFKSLRMVIADDEETWLDQEFPDWDADPDDHFIDDETERALLNTDVSVKIGNSIYMLQSDGSYFEITNGSFAIYDGILAGTIDPAREENVVIHNPDVFSKRSGCNSNKRNASRKANSSNNRRIKWVVSHWTHPWGRRVMAKTKNYRKRRRRWRKYRTYCEAMVHGSISSASGDCSSSTQFNASNGWFASATRRKVKHRISVSTKTKSGWVKSRHRGAGGVTHNRTLTW